MSGEGWLAMSEMCVRGMFLETEVGMAVGKGKRWVPSMFSNFPAFLESCFSSSDLSQP